MGTDSDLSLSEILRSLCRHRIEFVVVGAFSAVMLGHPVLTEDIDIVFDRSLANRERLLEAIEEMDAIYRGQFGRRIKPKLHWLESDGHHLLQTKFGKLDLLGTIGAVGEELAYADLLPFSTEIEVEPGMKVKALRLEKLIEMKKRSGRPKDLHGLFFLEKLLEERTQQGLAGDA